jgi:hypothetical protein
MPLLCFGMRAGHNNWPHGGVSHDRYLLFLNSGSTSRLAALETGELTATSVTCAGDVGTATPKRDLCAYSHGSGLAREKEAQEKEAQENTNEDGKGARAQHAGVALQEEVKGLRAEVAQLRRMVQELAHACKQH